jgi:hypothetical protein
MFVCTYVYTTTMYVYDMCVCMYEVSACGIAHRDFEIISVTLRRQTK